MFQRTDMGSLKYLMCKSTLQVYEVDWKRYRRYVLLREREVDLGKPRWKNNCFSWQ